MAKHYLEPGTMVWSDARFILGENGEHIFDCINDMDVSTVYVEELDYYMEVRWDSEERKWYWEDF